MLNVCKGNSCKIHFNATKIESCKSYKKGLKKNEVNSLNLIYKSYILLSWVLQLLKNSVLV